jgi:hypothetical protein
MVGRQSRHLTQNDKDAVFDISKKVVIRVERP